jgi:predicted Zn-ribbon and HTH transcriptional regulator
MAKPTQDSPSRNEDEFFAKQDAELMKQLRAKQDKERSAQERKAHFMKCPKCGADLKEETHGHVKIDVCPECKGMWLDAGEMEIMKHQQKGGAGIMGSFMDLLSRAGKK